MRARTTCHNGAGAGGVVIERASLRAVPACACCASYFREGHVIATPERQAAMRTPLHRLVTHLIHRYDDAYPHRALPTPHRGIPDSVHGETAPTREVSELGQRRDHRSASPHSGRRSRASSSSMPRHWRDQCCQSPLFAHLTPIPASQHRVLTLPVVFTHRPSSVVKESAVSSVPVVAPILFGWRSTPLMRLCCFVAKGRPF